MVVTTYNDHLRLLSPERFGWVQHHQLYSGVGADIVMESITLTDPLLIAASGLPALNSGQPRSGFRSRGDGPAGGCPP